jgi:hypothetical protein
MPPVDFLQLLAGAGESGAVAEELEQLLAAKSETSELGVAPRRLILDGFISTQIQRFDTLEVKATPPASYDILDNFFRTCLTEFGPTFA